MLFISSVIFSIVINSDSVTISITTTVVTVTINIIGITLMFYALLSHTVNVVLESTTAALLSHRTSVRIDMPTADDIVAIAIVVTVHIGWYRSTSKIALALSLR